MVKEDEKALLLNEIRIFFRVDWWGECCTLAVSKSDCPMKLVCYDDGLGLHVSHFLQSSPGISIKIFTVPCFTGFLFHHLHAAPNFFNLSAGWHLVLYLDFPNALTHVFFNDLCSKIIYLKIKKKYFCCLLKSLFMRQKFVLFLLFYHPCESLHQILAAL